MMKYLRATTRAVIGAATFLPVLALTALQGFVVGPLTGNQTIIPRMVYGGLRRLLGYKIEFNKESAPIVKDKQAWFVANHLSVDDFIILGSTLKGTFAGKGDILKWPVVAQMARAVNYIGLRRSKEYNRQSHAKIIKNFNAGYNTIMFPEATTTPGDKVYLFRAGLMTLLFGEKGVDKKGVEVQLNKDIVIQPIAIRVKKVNEKNAEGNADLRALYCMQDESNDLRRAWKRMMIRNMTIELTVLPPVDPEKIAAGKDLSTEAGRDAAAKELINQAALSVASVINPGQTTFEKAIIPGVENKPRAAPAAK